MLEQPLELEKIEEIEVISLKDILLDSKNRTGAKVICRVTTSRYEKILLEYWALNAIYVDGARERYLNYTRFYKLIGLDKNGNVYKIIKLNKIDEIKGKCNNCNCERLRWINPKTGLCYYKEMINVNYTTKI